MPNSRKLAESFEKFNFSPIVLRTKSFSIESFSSLFCNREHRNLRIDPNSSDLASLFIRRERRHVTRFPTSHGMRETFLNLALVRALSLSLSRSNGRLGETVGPFFFLHPALAYHSDWNRFRTGLYEEHR